MYIYYSIGNNSGPRTLVHIVEVSVIGGVRFRRYHCSRFQLWQLYLDYSCTSCNSQERVCTCNMKYLHTYLALLTSRGYRENCTCQL